MRNINLNHSRGHGLRACFICCMPSHRLTAWNKMCPLILQPTHFPQQLSSVPLQLSTAHRIACLLHVERCSTVAASAAVTWISSCRRTCPLCRRASGAHPPAPCSHMLILLFLWAMLILLIFLSRISNLFNNKHNFLYMSLYHDKLFQDLFKIIY
jgi:hypothetical protein